ncbi:glycosyltransferase [Candidatus Woesearchaeota archaeon]|nr:glycosyltransferase [Candidatus Woesearchaeota archaeon]
MVLRYSLVIPVAPYRDAEILEHIKNLDYPKDKYEIIVEHGPNASENRNKCIEKAQGEIIAILDDDAVIESNLLLKVDKSFEENPDIHLVGGPQLTPQDDKFFARISGYAIASFFGSFNMADRYRKGRLRTEDAADLLTSANCFVKKEVFEKAGKFNTNLWPGEDPEFFHRVQNNDFKVAYSPEIAIYHRRRPDLKSFAKQFYKYGFVAFNKEKTKSMKMGIVYFLPALFFIYLLLLPFLLYFNYLFVLPLVLYFSFAVLSAFAVSYSERSLAALFLLPLIYPIMHASYGIGVIKSIKENFF